jgi:type IV secretion system protein VirD4
MQSQVYTLIVAAAIMFAVIGGLSLLAYYYTLNGIKSRTVGDGQHGTARFASRQEIKKTYKHVPFQPVLWRKGESLPKVADQGIILGSQGQKNKVTALVDTDDIHCLMIGASGVGKTAFFLYPNLEFACASGMSFLSTDTKGDLFRSYGAIARDYYGYHVAVIDLRNPTRSDGNNMLHLVNTYMDTYRADNHNLSAKAKAEKYAKIIAKTLINASGENFGQNQFFYDAAEGLLTSVILLVAEYLPPTEVDGKKTDSRHIISVFKLVQDLMAPGRGGKSQFQLLMDKLPPNHKARWFAGAALNSSDQAMASVLSTVLSRLNAFLDSEMEQILCFDTAIDAERFCNEKSALFIILPEEDLTKYFFVSLMIQQLYREILAVADENGGKLKNRVMFYCDELGTLPAIESLELIFSASRSRRLSLVPIIQSLGQLEKNYGKEGAEIIVDNCQDTIFGGFAPNSQTAEVLSKALGSRTVMSGSISRGKNDPSQSLQMIERPLMTPDELKSLPKGRFVVMKTGTHPIKTRLRLFLDWGITFGKPYAVEEKSQREVIYADKQTLEENIVRKHFSCHASEDEAEKAPAGSLPPEKPQVEKSAKAKDGSGTLHTPVAEPREHAAYRRTDLKT